MVRPWVFLPFVAVGAANEVGAGDAVEFEEVAVVGEDGFDGRGGSCEDCFWSCIFYRLRPYSQSKQEKERGQDCEPHRCRLIREQGEWERKFLPTCNSNYLRHSTSSDPWRKVSG